MTTGFVDALQARVALYEEDWAAAVAEADEVLAQGYTLAPDFTTLFDAEGTDTPEDILKIVFTAEQYCWHGYYYISADLGGAGTVGPSQKLIDMFDPAESGAPGRSSATPRERPRVTSTPPPSAPRTSTSSGWRRCC